MKKKTVKTTKRIEYKDVPETRALAYALNSKNTMQWFSYFEDMHKIQIVNEFGEIPNWNKLTFKQRTFKGWLKVLLFKCETMINGRWAYWLDLLMTNDPENKPIPQLHFKPCWENSGNCKNARDVVKKCLNYNGKGYYNGSDLFYLLIDWLLWGLGSDLITEFPAKVNDELNEYWYRNFCVEKLLAQPADYWVTVASEIYSNKYFNANAFYPTPAHVVQFMTEITFNDKPGTETTKYCTVLEPCMGSGIMLLYASNYSLRLYGVDIDPFMCKIGTLNGYLFVPWLVWGPTKELNNKFDELHNKYVKSELEDIEDNVEDAL